MGVSVGGIDVAVDAGGFVAVDAGWGGVVGCVGWAGTAVLVAKTTVFVTSNTGMVAATGTCSRSAPSIGSVTLLAIQPVVESSNSTLNQSPLLVWAITRAVSPAERVTMAG